MPSPQKDDTSRDLADAFVCLVKHRLKVPNMAEARRLKIVVHSSIRQED